MNGEVSRKTVAFAVKCEKMTEDVLRELLRKAIKDMKAPEHGKQSIDKLVKSRAALQNIEITEKNIKSFNKIAAKYDIDYALQKDDSTVPATYFVYFKGKNLRQMNEAFKEYTRAQTRDKPSIIAQLDEIEREMAMPAIENELDMKRNHEQTHDRGERER